MFESSRAYHGVISKIGGRLIGRGSSGRALPARDIDGVKVLCHLGDHCGFETAVGEASNFFLNDKVLATVPTCFGVKKYLEVALQNFPKLLALDIRRVLNL